MFVWLVQSRLWAIIMFFAFVSYSSAAEADSPGKRDDAIKQRVREFATAASMYVEAWWSAELDGDAAPEYVARLCSKPDANTGLFLIIDGEKEYKLRFDVDGRTPWCREGELDSRLALRVVPDGFEPSQRGKVEPPFRHTRDRYVEHWQGGHSSSESVRIALRAGKPALIWRVQKFRPHCSEEMSDKVTDFREDWDALSAEESTYRYDGRNTGRMLGRRQIRLVPWAQCGSACAGLREDQLAESGELGFIGRAPMSVLEGASRFVKVGGGRYPRPDEAMQAQLRLDPADDRSVE